MSPQQLQIRNSILIGDRGTTINWQGTDYSAVLESIDAPSDIPNSLPDSQFNAAWSDRRIFTLAAWDFNQAIGPFPMENETVLWPTNGIVYIVHKKRPISADQVLIQWEITTYRSPKAGSDSNNPTNENGAW